MPRLVDRLHRHAARQRGITDDAADVMRFILAVARNRHSERGGDGSGSKPPAERVVLRFFAAEESAYPAILLHGGKQIAASRHEFMRVSPVTRVPDESVA